MNHRAGITVHLAAFTGLAVSFFLVVQYSLPLSAGACPVGGGCHVVRTCAVAGVPSGIWPQLGTAGFLLMLALSLAGGRWAAWALRAAATVGALIGATLMVSQKLVCGAFCPYCLVTDAAAIAVAAGAWSGRVPAGVTRVTRAAYAVLTVATLGGMVAWGMHSANAPNTPVHLAELPGVITREQRPGSAAVVEFMDFTCPHCRQQHPGLLAAVSPYGDRVRIIRRYVAFNPEGETAARAAYCGEAQGRAGPMLDALIQAEDLHRAALEALAARLGLELPAFSACLDAPQTTARFEADRAASREVLVVRLPTTFVGADRFEGEVPVSTLRASLDAALHAQEASPAPPR